MKYITSVIITTSVFFLSFGSSFAAVSWEYHRLWGILELEYGIEQYELELADINNIYCRWNLRTQLNAAIDLNHTIKSEMIRLYRNGNISYTEMNGIVSAHSKFVYYINDYFYYSALKQRNASYWEVETAILRSWKYARSYHAEVQKLLRYR